MSAQNILEKIPLFQGIHPEERETLLQCLGAEERRFRKNERILEEEKEMDWIGILLEGEVHVFSDDVFGNRHILEQLSGGELFGAAFACAGLKKSPVTAAAVKDSRVLKININRILTVCPASCPFHQKLLTNLVRILAQKNVSLSEKIGHLSRRSTKEKLLSYLSETSKNAGSMHIIIPFNRQELADYLCVERSAMSAELSKLRREGVLDYRKNEFWLYREPSI